MSKIRLLTFNIAHGRGLSLYQGFHSERGIRKNLAAIARLLRDSGADIVALQEVDERSHWNKALNLARLIQEEAGYAHAELGVNNRRDGAKPLAYGNAILSRFPVHYWDNQPFGEATLGEKGFLYAEVELGGQALPVINLHLDFSSRKRRILQVERVVAYLRERTGSSLAPIICGDFNSRSKPVNDAVQHLFHTILDYGDYTIYPAGQRTFPAHWPRKGIDFVFVPRLYTVCEHRVLKSYLSDHLPVLVELEMPG
ncbi:MAG: endonuclease/exonuclease/phosphatase family protein [Verrucomicrobiota bacterium]